MKLWTLINIDSRGSEASVVFSSISREELVSELREEQVDEEAGFWTEIDIDKLDKHSYLYIDKDICLQILEVEANA